MRKLWLVSLCVVSLAVPALAESRYLVLFKNDGIPGDFASAVTAAGGTLARQHASGLAAVTNLSEAGAGALGARNDVEAIVLDGSVLLGDGILLGDGATLGPGSATAPQLASYFPRQWHLTTVGADVAWAAGRLGSPDVTVAVLDTGIDYTHPDLAGLVDLSRSVSFVPSDDADVAALYPGRHPVTDLYYHGTHVASTIASNGIYAAGVTSRTTLIGVKVLGRDGGGTFDGIFAGVLWAADHGADVMNISIQSWFDRQVNHRFIKYIDRVFEYARKKGVLAVTIAGNQNRDLDASNDLYQAFCTMSHVLCVSATGPTSSAGLTGPWFNVDQRAFYSNYGQTVIGVAAPGGTVPGLVWGACATTSQYVVACQSQIQAVPAGGTSQAAPHVAGLAALLIEDIGHGKPSLIRTRIEQSADDLGAPGTDPVYGKGRINIPRALGLQ